ncbi:MAG: helix-turn-helix transcriptional regulator [Polyangiales bacterium]
MSRSARTRSERVRALRHALKLSQSALATRTGGLDQSEVNKIEVGRNQASTHRVLAALARGFGLPLDDLVAYLDGALDLKTMVSRCQLGVALLEAPGALPEVTGGLVVPVPDESGAPAQVPLRELIRVYQRVAQLGGLGVLETIPERLSIIEARLDADVRRQDEIERKLQEALDQSLPKETPGRQERPPRRGAR